MKVVLANGCFDVLHPGHIAHLLEARKQGDFLIVSLTLDAFVNKGPNRPVIVWEGRALMLRELRCVDSVIPCTCAVEAIRQVRPQVFVKGDDYRTTRFTEDIKGACKAVGATLFLTGTPKQSSTDIIKKAKDWKS